MADPQTLARMLMPPPNPAAAPQWAQEAAYNTFVQPIADAYKAQSPQDLLAPVMGAMAPPMAKAGMLAKGLAPEVNALTKGIRAYHGSPYDFDRFDLSKIGTGEGAQAYGHGLYFAGNERVAMEYRDKLGGLPIHQDLQTGLWRAEKRVGGELIERDFKTQADAEAWALPGKMYEVNLNVSPDQLLDWDRPLREQPQAVRDVLAAQGNLGTRAGYLAGPGEPSGGNVYKALAPTTAQTINSRVGPYTVYPSDEVAATRLLKEAGIPGIQYLDQGSRNLNVQMLSPKETTHGQWVVKDLPNGQVYYRGPDEAAARAAMESAPQQTRNYVMFDPELIKIVRKYGLAGLTAGPALGAALSQQDGQGGN